MVEEQYDPSTAYELHFDGDRIGYVQKGVYFEGPKQEQCGEIREGVFFYNGKAAGTLDGLTLLRTHPEPMTIMQLIPLEG
ncbi:hypothetical protein ACIP66_03175 [Pseudomonas sp. NPDC088429]|uniref:hypothetical protein n=1 Tax=Pseudomonas sp. NPDC088429 TaxID=3364455 RepID=UPI0037F28404